MSTYHNPGFGRPLPDARLDASHAPAAPVPHSGTYRCQRCGHEIVSVAGQKFPPQHHHPHTV